MLAHLQNLRERMAALLAAPRVMGIVNVTPNSFSDTGKFFSSQAAAAHAEKLVADGASILDLGAEASSFFREGVAPVPPAEQIARLVPVLERIRNFPALISVDTRSAEVAQTAIENGAHILNDISAGEHDPAMLSTAARLSVPIILMHMSPSFPATPTVDDPDIVATVSDYLKKRVAEAVSAGVLRHNIILDMGLGFGKTMADNWRLVSGTLALRKLGFPLILGASRKRFLETAPPEDIDPSWREKLQKIQQNTAAKPKTEHPRDLATWAVTKMTAQTANMHRVHDARLVAAAFGAVASV